MHSNSLATDVLEFTMNSSCSGLRACSRGLFASSDRVNPVSLTTFATQQLFYLASETTIHICIYGGVDSWITRNQNNGDYVSGVTKIVLGTKMDKCVDDEVWGPTQYVDYTDRHNHFSDAFSHAYDALRSKSNSINRINHTCGRIFKRVNFVCI